MSQPSCGAHHRHQRIVVREPCLLKWLKMRWPPASPRVDVAVTSRDHRWRTVPICGNNDHGTARGHNKNWRANNCITILLSSSSVWRTRRGRSASAPRAQPGLRESAPRKNGRRCQLDRTAAPFGPNTRSNQAPAAQPCLHARGQGRAVVAGHLRSRHQVGGCPTAHHTPLIH